MKRMMHPKHGYHLPLNSADREEMLKNGWVDEPDEKFVEFITDALTEAAEFAPVRRKPGPKPKAKQ